LGSFAGCPARELGVTPGAITAQCQALEAELTRRSSNARGAKLRDTAGAPRFCRDLTQAFDAVGSASQTCAGRPRPKPSTSATLPALDAVVLSPRLPELRKTDPDIHDLDSQPRRPANLKRRAV